MSTASDRDAATASDPDVAVADGGNHHGRHLRHKPLPDGSADRDTTPRGDWEEPVPHGQARSCQVPNKNPHTRVEGKSRTPRVVLITLVQLPVY